MSHRFNSEETRLVLARAAELQAVRDSTGEITEEELQRAAAEAGLDDALVAQAISDIVADRVEPEVEVKANTVVASAEVPRRLSDAERDELVARLAHEFGGGGRLVRDGSRWTWSSSENPIVQLTVSEVSGASLVRLTLPTYGQVAKPLLVGYRAVLAGIVTFLATGILLGLIGLKSDAQLVMVLLSTVASTLAVSRHYDRSRASTRVGAVLSRVLRKLRSPQLRALPPEVPEAKEA